MRFDDSLKTVLSADMESGFGAQSAWRQLVDLIGRGRAEADEAALAKLRALRPLVPDEVRAASGRALAFATPPAPLVALFAEDALAVSAPVLRTATLDASEWLALLPKLNPEGRALLRHRRDLPREAIQGLEGYEPVDFVLPPAAVAPSPDTPRGPEAAVEEAGEDERDATAATTPAAVADAGPAEGDLDPNLQGGFRIADVVARIDAFQRQRDETPAPVPVPLPLDTFRFETDANGLVVAVDGGARAALIGVSLATAMRQGGVTIDTAVAAAFRARRRFRGAALAIGGRSELAGDWQAAGLPLFDPASGRFTGYLCTARRAGDTGAPATRRVASETLRQLVHELRTPTNAIAGFAELIESQLLGPVPAHYREHALTIQAQAARLVAAIEDLDTAARIEGAALELYPEEVALEPLLTRIAADLSPLAAARDTGFDIHPMGDHAALTDARAVERLLSRVLAALAGAAAPGERIDVAEAPAPDGQVALCFARPEALVVEEDDALLSLDDPAEGADGTLLGPSFGLKLARDLAREMGGALTLGEHLLTLRLPAGAHAPAAATFEPA